VKSNSGKDRKLELTNPPSGIKDWIWISEAAGFEGQMTSASSYVGPSWGGSSSTIGGENQTCAMIP
jgi:hypothetical protein